MLNDVRKMTKIKYYLSQCPFTTSIIGLEHYDDLLSDGLLSCLHEFVDIDILYAKTRIFDRPFNLQYVFAFPGER